MGRRLDIPATVVGVGFKQKGSGGSKFETAIHIQGTASYTFASPNLFVRIIALQ
jgi:hypothetical protein